MAEKKILIVDELHSLFQQEAERQGYIVDYHPEYKLEDTLKVLAEYDGLAIRSKFRVDKAVVDAAPKLKFVARAGAGVDNIDEAYIKEKGIILLNAPEGNRDAVGEHTIGLLLALMNNLKKGDLEVRDGIWDREGNRGYELKGKTIGIIGYGNMGQAFAKKLKGFEVEVIAFDKYKTNFSDEYAKEVSMEQIVKYSDILSLHIPLTRETRKLVDDEYLFHFRKPIFLVNTARGEIVDTKAILKAIANGRIKGAALDVLEVEKFPALSDQEWFNELKENGKVLLSPHVAGWSFESFERISHVLAEKLKKLK